MFSTYPKAWIALNSPNIPPKLRITISISERPYMGFAIRSRASRRSHSYPYYHCSVLDITFKMESSVKHLQLIFGRKRNNRSTCHLFSQDTDITSRSVSNRSASTSKLGVWSLLKVPVRWFFAHHSMVWWLSLICHVCFVSLWFAVRLCVIQLYCPRPLPAKSLLSLLPVPSYWISWLVIGFKTSAPPEIVCVAVEQSF